MIAPKNFRSRKLLIFILALALGMIVVESRPVREWWFEAAGFIAPTVSVLEFLIPKSKETKPKELKESLAD